MFQIISHQRVISHFDEKLNEHLFVVCFEMPECADYRERQLIRRFEIVINIIVITRIDVIILKAMIF
jgi:hypothetical protein